MKFTQEIKDNWIKNLKSGKYQQGFSTLKTVDNKYCCIGVLADCTEGLEIEFSNDIDITNPYKFLRDNAGDYITTKLWKTNDNDSEEKSYPCDYRNVIPLIESIPTN